MESKNKEVDVIGVIDASGFVTSNARRIVNAGGVQLQRFLREISKILFGLSQGQNHPLQT